MAFIEKINPDVPDSYLFLTSFSLSPLSKICIIQFILLGSPAKFRV